MDDNGLEIVKLRKNFYKDSFRRLVFVVLFQTIVIILMTMLVLRLYSQKPEPEYFATSSDGRIIPVSPLNQNQYSDSMILQWATETIRKTFSYDYINYRSHFETISQSFTPFGWTNFQDAMKQSGNLEYVAAQRLISSSESTGVAFAVTYK